MKKFIFKSLLALGAITVPLAGGATLLASCVSASDAKLTQSYAAQYWNSFLNENHGRWTGNISNFSNIKSDNTGLESNETLTALHPLDTTTIEKDVNNYGSYHAYQWLLNEVKKMGYTNKTETVSIPTAGTVTTTTTNSVSHKTISAATDSNTQYYKISDARVSTSTNSVTRGERGVIYNNPSAEMSNLMANTGIVTQAFLWNGNDRGNGVAETFNNVGHNLIVTLNPDDGKTTTTEPYDFWIVSHYDSTAKTGAGQAQASWGATDNATSVAVNLAILKYFSNIYNRIKLKTRVHIVFADAEEVGVQGSTAFVKQFLDGTDTSANASSKYPLLASSWGMINLDTIAGGDFMYVHSSSSSNSTDNTSTAIRDLINSISQDIASEKSDSRYELQIHKEYHYGNSAESGEDMPEGLTGDWSDHKAFYQIAKMPVAYFESTNFALQSKTADENDQGVFDGYSQTRNKYAWITWDHVPVEMKETTDENGETIWVMPEGYTLSDFLIGGDIWHSDIDTPDWLATYIGNTNIYRQLDASYLSLLEFLTTITPQKFSSSDSGSSSTSK